MLHWDLGEHRANLVDSLSRWPHEQILPNDPTAYVEDKGLYYFGKRIASAGEKFRLGRADFGDN